MTTLNDEMADVRSEIEDVRAYLRAEIPDLFEFDVTVGNVSYNATTNSVTVVVEPSSSGREEVAERMGGVNVSTDGRMEFEFGLTASEIGEK